jgi:hypothetical protein
MGGRAALHHFAFSRLPMRRRGIGVKALLVVGLLVALLALGQLCTQLALAQGGSGPVQKKQIAPHVPNKDPNSPEQLDLSPEQQYLLMKLQIERELQDEILKWAQTRFWILAGVSVVVGFFGVRSFMREMVSSELKDAMRASAEANAAATQGKDAVKEVRAEAAKYSATVMELTAAAGTVDQKFRELSSRIDAEGTRSVAAANLKVTAIDQQLGELRRIVEVLAKDSEGTKRALVEFEQRRTQAQQSAASTQAEFDENSTFTVTVVSHGTGSLTEPTALRVVDALSKLGFKASSSSWASGVPVNEDIKIAYRSRAAKKIELIRTIVATAVIDIKDSSRKIHLSQTERPIGNTDDDVAVFF